MSFLNFDLSLLFSETSIAILFVIVLAFFLYKNKERVKIQKILFPVLYMILYKTKWGIKSMDKVAKKHPKLVQAFGTSGVWLGFIGMIGIFGLLIFYMIKIVVDKMTTPTIGFAQPFVPTEPGSVAFYIPFSYFIIVIFVIATVHEFAHGVVARLHKVKIKSSGFAFFSIFLPILPAAFVEPDDKQVKKLKLKDQLSIYAAGPMSNLVLALLIGLLAFGMNAGLGTVTENNVLIVNYTSYAGEEINGTYPAQASEVKLLDKLEMLDNTQINKISDFVDFMENTSAGQEIVLKTNSTSYNIVLDSHPNSPENGYLGLMAVDIHSYKDGFKDKFAFFIPIFEWFFTLVFLLIIFNLGVGLMNLFPLGGLDGGQMLLAVLRSKFKEDKAVLIWGKVSLVALFILLANFILPFIMKFMV